MKNLKTCNTLNHKINTRLIIKITSSIINQFSNLEICIFNITYFSDVENSGTVNEKVGKKKQQAKLVKVEGNSLLLYRYLRSISKFMFSFRIHHRLNWPTDNNFIHFYVWIATSALLRSNRTVLSHTTHHSNWLVNDHS